jgi:hypothetical protein
VFSLMVSFLGLERVTSVFGVVHPKVRCVF